jgi:hypothetical protein
MRVREAARGDDQRIECDRGGDVDWCGDRPTDDLAIARRVEGRGAD